MILTRYDLTSESSQDQRPIKMALVADLHERPYEHILDMLREEKPDVILLSGDTLERKDENYMGLSKLEMDRQQGISRYWTFASIIMKHLGLNKTNDMYSTSGQGLRFLEKASEIAPVIMSVGNHEWYFTEEDRVAFEKYHIHLLDNDALCLEAFDRKIWFGGLSTRYNMKWLKSFSRIEGYKILLSHHPEYYLRYIKGRKWDTFDLVISGHAHGGQCRVGKYGLFAPGQGFFARYVHGLYGKHLISSGASNTAFFPRVCNPEEIVILKI